MPKALEFVFREVGYSITPKIVRIKNDHALEMLLRDQKRDAARYLAEEILNRYESEFGDKLKISKRSLACEIYDHYRLLILTRRAERIFGNCRPVRWMKEHMDVIDCGEEDVDNNRFLWNLFSIFWKK